MQGISNRSRKRASFSKKARNSKEGARSAQINASNNLFCPRIISKSQIIEPISNLERSKKKSKGGAPSALITASRNNVIDSLIGSLSA